MVWSRHILTAASCGLSFPNPPLSPVRSPPPAFGAPPTPPAEIPACLFDPLADALAPVPVAFMLLACYNDFIQFRG